MLNEILSELSIGEFSAKFPDLFYRLLLKLNLNDSWNRVLSYLASDESMYRISISDNQLFRMKSSDNPSLILLNELDIRLYKVNHLQNILSESELFDALSVISDPEELKIVKEPREQCISLLPGSLFTLEFLVTGLPPPSYQWYHENIALPNQTTSCLRIQNFGEEDEGYYYCIAKHVFGNRECEKTSTDVEAQLIVAPQFIKNIGDNPVTYVVVDECQDYIFNVKVFGRPQPKFEWTKDNIVLKDETTDTLLLKNVEKSNEGAYRCVVRNKCGEVTSNVCHLTVSFNPERGRNKASIKVALLIGNNEYKHHKKLYTPCNDVAIIAYNLKQLGFNVIPFQNLNLVEMSNAIDMFCKILPKDAYALFCFVGHGFEVNKRYMVAVDSPSFDQFNINNYYCDDMLIKKVMNTKAQLLVIMLDMCLNVLKNRSEPVIDYERNPNCSLIRNYSTSSNMSSYEKKTEDLGIYTKFLIKFIRQDIPIIEVFRNVIKEFGYSKEITEETRQKQKPSSWYDDYRDFKFTDPSTVSVDEEFHKKLGLFNLPEKVELNFSRVGVTVDVKFSFHKCCFVNSLDIIFPVELNAWKINAEANREELKKYQWSKNDKGESILTFFGLQKAKSDIYLVVQLNRKTSKNNELIMVDNCELDLDFVGIVKHCLWFKKKKKKTLTE
ncbi:mucosa-associated lymphoid tissue lymphoma translocation protein 1-like [Lycorma delicatula]|uniref:mucosa-associated lymphoid tissue lymphoma translocation protein 1-like n=1 Tax=Lycorma delicatula TaxID=130591 RepID=UPI003F519813